MKTLLCLSAAILASVVMQDLSFRSYGETSDEQLPNSQDSSKLRRPRYEFRAPYFQRQKDAISFDQPITCVFQTYSVAGYAKKDLLNNDSEILEQADITPDEAPNVWKIALHGKTADLIISGGGWKDIKNEPWTVVLKTDQRLILSSVKSYPGSIRTITINAQYGTFVQCFNGEFGDVNHGAMSWGYCTNQ